MRNQSKTVAHLQTFIQRSHVEPRLPQVQSRYAHNPVFDCYALTFLSGVTGITMDVLDLFLHSNIGKDQPRSDWAAGNVPELVLAEYKVSK